MKLHSFHLMPYSDLPEDFKEKYRSVWVDVPSHLFDPAKAHDMYNDYLDELEFAAEIGFDGICVNEHHQNAYGLMPSPNLMAAALAAHYRRTPRIVVLGNCWRSTTRRRASPKSSRCSTCISGGRLVAGFPVGTPMDTNYGYGTTPATLRDKYHEAHDLVVKAWTKPEPFTFERQVHPAALRQHLAAPDPEAAPADLDARAAAASRPGSGWSSKTTCTPT